MPTLPLASGRTDHIATLLPNGKILVAGGFNSADTGPSTELYDPASAVATPASLGLTKLSDKTVQIMFRNTPGLTFKVLTTTNPAIPASLWPTAANAVETSPGHYQFTDSSTTNVVQSFYRFRSLR